MTTVASACPCIIPPLMQCACIRLQSVHAGGLFCWRFRVQTRSRPLFLICCKLQSSRRGSGVDRSEAKFSVHAAVVDRGLVVWGSATLRDKEVCVGLAGWGAGESEIRKRR